MAISAATDLMTQLWTSRCSIYHGGLGRILQLVFLCISLEQRSSQCLMTIILVRRLWIRICPSNRINPLPSMACPSSSHDSPANQQAFPCYCDQSCCVH